MGERKQKTNVYMKQSEYRALRNHCARKKVPICQQLKQWIQNDLDEVVEEQEQQDALLNQG